eukprot:gene16472-18109_t
MASFQVNTPDKFNFKPEEWGRWIRRFERFRIAAKLNKESEEAQVNTLIYSMGEEADDILASLKLTGEERKSYKTVKEKFDNHFVIKRNVIYERAKFNMRSQKDGEPVDSFITDLFSLAEHCGFGELHDELIRDRIVVGLADRSLSERLQLEADLTLEKAITQARQKELVHQQQGILRQKADSGYSGVDQIKAKKSSGKLGNSKVFSKLDANSAFWQRKLSENSQLMTTFITPWGRYCFLRLPYGITTGSEQFQRCMSEKLAGLDGVECNIDDVLVHGSNQKEHDQRLHTVLKRLQEANITLNPDKCEFSKTSIKILGHIVSAEGIKADPEKIESILRLPVPKNVADVRSFLGMVNQQSKFAPDLANKTKPLRDLLSKNNTWMWGPPQQKAFNEIKRCLTEAPVLALYDCNRQTKITADASSYGIGGVVYQLQEDHSWKPIAYFSRALTPVESRYSQIEKECLAFTWLAERASDYILGKEIVGETDHKPLVPLLTTHCLDQLPPRIQRMRMRLMRFNIKSMVHIPGKEMYASDMLSRMIPVSREDNEHSDIDTEIEHFVCSIIDTIPVSDIKLRQLMEAQNEDEVTKKVIEYCQEGWPEKYQLPSAILPFWSDRGEIYP